MILAGIVMIFYGVAILLAMVLLGRVVPQYFRDRARIRLSIEARGGLLVRTHMVIHWSRLFRTNAKRRYLIRYLDAGGNEISCSCETSVATGVSTTGERIVTLAKSRFLRGKTKAVAKILAENQRLREALDRREGAAGS